MQVHRAAMLLSLFTAGVGFLVIFVANKDYIIPGLIPLKKVILLPPIASFSAVLRLPNNVFHC